MPQIPLLDLKYRPKKFSEVIGNAGTVKVLLARSRSGSLHDRSMMFGGPKGCGKTTLARIVARAASCLSVVDGEPCNSCPICESLLNETSVGVEEFDAASHGSVERIRSLVDGLDYGTADGLRPALILDEAQRLGPGAQDALLKAMEERRITILMCTTEPGKIRPAVRDRVDEYSIRPPSISEIFTFMASVCKTEAIPFEDEALTEIAKACGCTPRSCLNSIYTIISSGDSLTLSSVRNLFRYGQIQALAKVLTYIDSEPSSALSELDSILASESSSWVRENIVKLISSAARKSIGVQLKLDVPTDFYSSRSPSAWADLVKFLSSIEKPLASDIEFALISTSRSWDPSRPAQTPVTQAPVTQAPVTQAPVTQVPVPTQTSVVPIPTQIPIAPVSNSQEVVQTTDVSIPEETRWPSIVSSFLITKEVPQKPEKDSKNPLQKDKTVEIDGVTFSSSERLTSLDSKMESSRGPAVPEQKEVDVHFDPSKVPMSAPEFSRGFLDRIRQLGCSTRIVSDEAR